MGNCLVTKLNGVVDNDTLLKLGEYKFGASNYADSWFVSYLDSSMKIRAVDNNMIDYSTREHIDYAISGQKFATTSVTNVILSNIYKVQHVRHLLFSTDLFMVATRLTDLEGVLSGECKFEGFQKCSNTITYISLWNHMQFGKIPTVADLQFMRNLTNLTNLSLGEYQNVGYAQYYWPLSVIGAVVPNSLNKFTTSREFTSVADSIENFVSGLRVNRTTGTIGRYSNNCSLITFNGSLVGRVSDVELSWTETTITFNGVTINA